MTLTPTPTTTRVADLISRRPGVVFALAMAVTALCALGIPQLEFETSQESFIGEQSTVAQNNRRFQAQFGGEPMLVLFSADEGRSVIDLLSGENLVAMRRLEADLSNDRELHAVLGPVAALEFARAQVPIGLEMIGIASAREQQQARDAVLTDGGTAAESDDAAAEVAAGFDARIAELSARLGEVTAAGAELGLDDPLSLENPAFVRFLLYEDAAETTIRGTLRQSFVDDRHALMVVRLPGNTDIATAGAKGEEIETIAEGTELVGFEVLATGSPPLLNDINKYLQGGLATLGALAFGVMVAVLALVFRVRWRLLSMGIVTLGTICGFGIMGFLGVPLTLITISGLPILIGVGVDFSIQTHSRFEEEVDRDGDRVEALRRVMRTLGPALGVAMVAAVGGFLALQMSEVPLIRSFGVMLAIGIAAMFLAGLPVASAVLEGREQRRPTRAGDVTMASGALERVVRRLCTFAGGATLPLVAIGIVIIVAGLAVEGRFTIQTDPERWVPQDGQTVQDLHSLRAGAGFSTELSLLIEADDVTATPVARWMEEYSAAQLTEHGDELVHGFSLAAIASDVTGAPPGQEELDLLLGGALDDPPTYDMAPEDIVESFISPDRTKAALIFPITNIPLDRRSALLDELLADLDPPPGATVTIAPRPDDVTVTPAGLVVVGVRLVELLEANRSLITWTAIAAVGLWLLLWYRRLSMAILPLFPVLIAIGGSSLVIFATGLELSPLTTVTGPLVIAVCTEFTVLLLARYVEERGNGRTPEEAVALGAVRIGRAFVASGLTAIGGFAVLALSSFPLLRDFGIVVALSVLVALISALVVLPPLLMWADGSRWVPDFHPGRGREPL